MLRRRWPAALLIALLPLALATVALLYVRASRPPYDARHEPLVARATRSAAQHLGTSESEMRRTTFAAAVRLTGQTCVVLREKRSNLPAYQACYDDRSGATTEERLFGSPFGPRRYFPSLW